MKKKWLPAAIIGGAVITIIAVLLILNPPFVQNIFNKGSASKNEDGSSKIVAKVGNSKLTLEDYKAIVNMYVSAQNQGQVDPKQIIESWVEQEIIYQHAKKIGLEKKDSVKLLLDQLKFTYELNKKQLLVQAWLAEEAKNIVISDADIRSYYEAHKDEFLYEIKVSYIVLANPNSGTEVYQRLEQGASFVQMAKEFSLDQVKGEPTPYFPRLSGLFTMPVEEKIFALKKGEYTQPMITSQGVLIIKMLDKRKVRSDISFAELAQTIRAILVNQRAERVIMQKVDSLKAKAQSDVEIKLESLLF